MDEANSYFHCSFRSEKNIHFLKLIIAKVNAIVGNDVSKQLGIDLKTILSEVQAVDQKIEDLWTGKTTIKSLEVIEDLTKSMEKQPCILDNEWKLPLLSNIIKWSLLESTEGLKGPTINFLETNEMTVKFDPSIQSKFDLKMKKVNELYKEEIIDVKEELAKGNQDSKM